MRMRMRFRDASHKKHPQGVMGRRQRRRAKSYGQAKRKRTGRADVPNVSTRKELWAGGKEVHLTVV